MVKGSRVSFPVAAQWFHRKNYESRRALGMGCATIGRAADAETLLQFQRTLDYAFENGIRYFDTSAKYGGSWMTIRRSWRCIR